MLQFAQDDTSAELILTLTEKVTLDVPYYLFVFTHVTTKDAVSFVKAVADDQSLYQSRYNQFTINPSVVFDEQPTGMWNYTIHEQEDDENTDVANTTSVLEYGKLILDRATAYAPTQYNSATSYKAYNG
jgi:hypothetical protein